MVDGSLGGTQKLNQRWTSKILKIVLKSYYPIVRNVYSIFITIKNCQKIVSLQFLLYFCSDFGDYVNKISIANEKYAV